MHQDLIEETLETAPPSDPVLDPIQVIDPILFKDATTTLSALATARPMSLAALAAAALAACGGGGGGETAVSGTSPAAATTTTPATATTTPTSTTPASTPSTTSSTTSTTSTTAPSTANPPTPATSTGYAYPTPAKNEDAARFLLQAGFAATDADIASVRATGYASWLNSQMALPAGTAGWDWLNSQGYGDVLSPNNYYDNTYPADYMVWNQLMAAPDPMRKRVALALSEFFVVSLNGLNFSWRSHAMAHYWDTLAANAFDNYRSLLEAVTLNPAMGYYLNTKGNRKEDSSGRQPDENYAREVMQLLTIGLYQLNPDGTAKTDGTGKKIDTYAIADVSNLARVFTGYDLDQSQNATTVVPQTGGGTRTLGNTAFTRLPMVLTAANHSSLAATFLGTTIPAGTAGAAALKTALDALFNHANTAPFFSRQMIQRLVTSNPSPAYVARVAAIFANNGAGVRGDLARVFSAILLDDEARGPAGLTQPEFGKLREPMLRLAQWARTFGVTSTSGAWKIGDLSNAGTQLGQSPLRSPSVFNFFRPGYVPPSTALTAGVVAPEFQIVTESSVGGYLNFMTGVIMNGLSSGDITAPYTSELALVTDAAALVQRASLLLGGGQVSAANQTLIVNALNATPVTVASSAAVKRNRVAAAVLMVMASAEYLVQK